MTHACHLRMTRLEHRSQHRGFRWKKEFPVGLAWIWDCLSTQWRLSRQKATRRTSQSVRLRLQSIQSSAMNSSSAVLLCKYEPLLFRFLSGVTKCTPPSQHYTRSASYIQWRLESCSWKSNCDLSPGSRRLLSCFWRGKVRTFSHQHAFGLLCLSPIIARLGQSVMARSRLQ